MRPKPYRTAAKAPPQRTPGPLAEPVLGLRAGLAVFARRKEDILRVAFAGDLRREVEPLGRWCEGNRVPVAEMRDAELDRLAESSHHEGLVVLTRPRRWASAQDVSDLLVRHKGVAIALDRVRNPYNIGAVLRSAAFFGVDAAILGTPAPHPGLPPLAVRVAEGGAEHLALARTTDLADTLSRLRARGVRVIGADGRAEASALGFAYGRSTIVVMGNEREGLGDRVRARCDALVAIRGSDAVESLNVAVASGVLLAELTRSQASRPGPR